MEKALAIQKEVMKILGTDEVYLVGGSVRDIVMGNEPKDYDFTTPMLPDEIELMCERRGRKTYSIGKKFGTIGFKVPYASFKPKTKFEPSTMNTGFEYVEVTTFRSEVYTSKSRKPEVQFVASLDEDLARRDFTMNAMVLRPDGTIYDPYGGKLDIHANMIKTVGMPKDRIQEDPLRMLRAARFAARYHFKIDPNFIGKARMLCERIYDVSIERWVQELDKLIISEYSYHGWEQLKAMNLAMLILPEVEDPEFNYYAETADQQWKAVLSNSNIVWEEPGSYVTTGNKLNRYLNAGICLRLKFSNERTDIILDKKKPNL